jgi:hypothetical protein
MEPDLRLDDRALLARCTVASFRSGGPGGQNTNRTESAVRVVHRASGEVAQCQDHRSHARNLADALARLRLRLAIAQRGIADPAWLEPFRRGRQVALGPHSASFPAVVAVALDALDANAGSLAQAAAAIGLSSSQLAKLLTADKEVRQGADALRARHGLGPLHA